jgi:CRP-like cAMP-binding protein
LAALAIVRSVALSTDEKQRWMQKIDLFRGCPPEAVGRIADRTVEVEFSDGQHMVTAGQVGNGLFIVVKGTARVQRGDDVITEFGSGDFFGELAVLDQQPRSASVIAVGDVTALGLASWDLIAEIEQDPQLALNLLRELSRRIRFLEDRHAH